MVIVSHRLSSLLDCDLIAVLDQGRLVDIAPHDALVERCAIYQQLWRQQNRYLDREPKGRPVQAPADAHELVAAEI